MQIIEVWEKVISNSHCNMQYITFRISYAQV